MLFSNFTVAMHSNMIQSVEPVRHKITQLRMPHLRTRKETPAPDPSLLDLPNMNLKKYP